MVVVAPFKVVVVTMESLVTDLRFADEIEVAPQSNNRAKIITEKIVQFLRETLAFIIYYESQTI